MIGMMVAHESDEFYWTTLSRGADVCPQVVWHGPDKVDERHAPPESIQSSVMEQFASHRQIGKRLWRAIREYEPLNVSDGQTLIHL
jgi:hypothetical protein